MQQSMQLPTFRSVNRMIIEESKCFKRFGGVRSYRLAKELLGDESEADKFMLSTFGGYTISELNRIKYKINRTSIKPG